jgi:tyrosine-protein kinase Etk/Wzc
MKNSAHHPGTRKRAAVKPVEESLFNQIISRYIYYWPLFIVLMIIFGSAAFVFLRYTTPKYEASATLIINDEKKGADNSKAMDALNMINSKKIIENEIEVLKSRSIMEEVVKSMHLYAPITIEGKLRNIPAFFLCPVLIEAKNPDSILSAAKVSLQYNPTTQDIFLSKRPAGKLNQWINTRYGIIRAVPNPHFRGDFDKKPYYFSLTPPREMAVKMLSSLKVVSENKLSSIVSLAYRDELPERCEAILNELIIQYDKASIDEKNSLAKNTLQFVQDRLQIVSKDLDSIESTVKAYKSGAGASDISTQGQLYLQNVSANDQELGRINMKLSVLEQVERAINGDANTMSGITPSTVGIDDPALTQLVTELNVKELEYERLRKTVAENNPLLVSLRDQINKIKPTIRENLRSQRSNLEASRSNLSSTNSQYNAMLSSIPEKEREILEKSRDQQVKSGIYSFLLQKKEESELSYASTLSDSRVINHAQATKFPVSPNKKFIFLGAIMAAIIIGIGFITAREGLSKTILYRKDLESMTQIPVIGEVAFNDSKESLVIVRGKRSFIAEEFRKIRASLHFLGINSSKRKILITSSIPGEGKSFISANLAISNALTGKKVVLMDVDLHNPGLGKFFGKSTKDTGLSDYLQGHCSLSDITGSVDGIENLHYIPSGTLHESPSELLLNGKIDALIEKLDAEYDMVILDTAPSVLITDAYILTNLCDTTLYVVRHKHTPKLILKRLDESMEINPLNNPGIIFNGVKKRGFFKNNYGYGYDYVYGGKYSPQSKR